MTPAAEHREKYARCVEALGRDALLALLPKVSRPWRELVAEDENLNNVPLNWWDAKHGPSVRRILRSDYGLEPLRGAILPKRGVFELYSDAARAGRYQEPGGWSLCNTVCTLKELARQLAEAGG
jgi:hypothetical protein